MTLPVMMYQEVIGRLDFSRGTVLGAVLLIPAVIAFLFDLFCRDQHNGQFQTKPFEPKSSILGKTAAYALCTVTSAAVLTPLISFVMLTLANRYPVDLSVSFRHIRAAMEKGAGMYLGNSVVISMAVAASGMIMAFLCAYLTSRNGRQGGKGAAFGLSALFSRSRSRSRSLLRIFL